MRGGRSARGVILCRLNTSYAALTLLLLGTPSVRAEATPIGKLAQQVVETVFHAKPADKSVVVCDFLGPTPTVTALGVELSDELSDNLSHSNFSLRVLDRGGLLQASHRLGVERELNACSPSAALLGVGFYVRGDLSVNHSQVHATLYVYAVGDDIPLGKFPLVLSFDESAQKLAAEEIHDTPLSPYTPSGSNGSSLPRCEHCPDAEYPDLAVKNRIQGSVLLVAVIDAQGHATETRVLQGLPDGLNDAAVAAVKRWRFKPAKDRSGKPIVVRQLIEIFFHLT